MKFTTTFLLLALLAISLLPSAQACLYYQGYYYDRDRYYQGYLTDNGVEVCKRVGYQSNDAQSQNPFSCIPGHYAWVTSDNSIVHYARDNQDFEFDGKQKWSRHLTPGREEEWVFEAWNYGC